MNFIRVSRMRYTTGDLNLDFSPLKRKFNLRVALWLWIGPIAFFLLTVQLIPSRGPLSFVPGLAFLWALVALVIRLFQLFEEPPKHSIPANQSEELSTEMLAALEVAFPNHEFWVSDIPEQNASSVRNRIYFYTGLLKALEPEEIAIVARYLSEPKYETRIRVCVVVGLACMAGSLSLWNLGGDWIAIVGTDKFAAKFVGMMLGMFGYLLTDFFSDSFLCNESFRRDAEIVTNPETASMLIRAIEKSMPFAERTSRSLSNERIRRIENLRESLSLGSELLGSVTRRA